MTDYDLNEHITTLTGECGFTQSLPDISNERDGTVSVSGAGTMTATDGATWECPRETLGDAESCLFHLTAPQRTALDIDPADVIDAFVTAVRSKGPRVKQFLGATLPPLKLNHQQLSAPDNYPTNLQHATIEGVLSIRNTDIGQPLHCEQATVDSIVIEGSRINASCRFDGATVSGDVSLKNQFDSGLVFSDAVIHGDFTAVPANFNLGVTCVGTVFDGDVEFYADFNDEPTFTDAVFRGETQFFVDVNADSYFKNAVFEGPFDLYAAFSGSPRFNGATFQDRFDFYGRVDADAHFPATTFEGPASFYRTGDEGRATRFYQLANFEGAEFEREADFMRVEFIGSANFENTAFSDLARFNETRFERRTRFNNIEFSDTLSFQDAVFADNISFEPVSAAAYRVADFTGANLSAGHLQLLPDDPVVFDLTRASVGNVSVDGLTEKSVFDHFIINRTNFNGFDFSDHRLELAQRDYIIHDTAVNLHEDANPHPGQSRTTVTNNLSSDHHSITQSIRAALRKINPVSGSLLPEDLEVTYLKAKNGAKSIDENEAVSRFFLREMRYRRYRHYRTAATADTWPNRLRAVGRAATNLVMGVTCGYGERPWRVVTASTGVVAVFAVLYALFAVPTEYTPSLLGYAILSIETFVALVLGSPEIESPVVNVLTSIEAFSGAYFIALFVFTLTRSIRR